MSFEVITDKITEIREAITKYASNGDTLSCDILHGRIGRLEDALAILAGEDEHLNELLSGRKS